MPDLSVTRCVLYHCSTTTGFCIEMQNWLTPDLTLAWLLKTAVGIKDWWVIKKRVGVTFTVEDSLVPFSKGTDVPYCAETVSASPWSAAVILFIHACSGIQLQRLKAATTPQFQSFVKKKKRLAAETQESSRLRQNQRNGFFWRNETEVGWWNKKSSWEKIKLTTTCQD